MLLLCKRDPITRPDGILLRTTQVDLHNAEMRPSLTSDSNSVRNATLPTMVADDPGLLRAMIEDAERTSSLWSPTAYWRSYRERIERELARSGLANFHTNQKLLKGFGVGGVPEPALPAAAWKRSLWGVLEQSPGVRRILAEQRRVLAAEYEHHRQTRLLHARLAMDEIARAFPQVDPPQGLANGGADDFFIWRGHTLVPAFVMYLSRAADFYMRVPPERVASIFEIGPGFGLSSLAHLALNPGLKVIVNLDIVPTLYFSTQFLKSIPGVEVMDYRALRGQETIVPEPGRERLRIYQLAPWQLPRLQGQIDFFFNSFSFHEMESDVCSNYATHVLRLVERGVMLHSSVGGHKRGAGGQRAPVTITFLESLFRGQFPNVAKVDGSWVRLFGADSEMTRLMTL
jgi:putative sugar O-methyltransferase